MAKENRLKVVLKNTSYTSADLARIFKLSRQAVSLWNKKGIPLKRVPEVSKLTGLSFHQLRPDIYPADEKVI